MNHPYPTDVQRRLTLGPSAASRCPGCGRGTKVEYLHLGTIRTRVVVVREAFVGAAVSTESMLEKYLHYSNDSNRDLEHEQ